MGKVNIAKFRRRRWWLGTVGFVIGLFVGGLLDGLVAFVSDDYLTGRFTLVGAFFGMGVLLLLGERKKLFPTDEELTDIERNQEMHPLGLDDAAEPTVSERTQPPIHP